MHISSLPSRFGVGTLGTEARRFVDFLCDAGQSFWQVLPVSPTGYGDSPYQPFSSYAGNPYFIDLDTLRAEGLLKSGEYESIDWGGNSERVDYGKLHRGRFGVLKAAASRLLSSDCPEFHRFCAENEGWLKDYALFMAIKDSCGGASWASWPRKLRFREPEALCAALDELGAGAAVHKAIQFFFFRQWDELKTYANANGIEIIGDIPIYAAFDSADLWSNPELFMLDNELRPLEVAGCPPDGFTEFGQLWGNPLYDWNRLGADGYGWWLDRIEGQFKLFDVLRIDHFRGLESFYAIPADAPDARSGSWRKGPGIELLRLLGRRRIIAEDLGFLTDSVRGLLLECGFPGMKVLQFAFDSRDGGGSGEYLPHSFISNCVAYAGTHDNSTMLGWFQSAPPEDAAFAREYMRIGENDDPVEAAIAALLASVADLAIVSMQDLLGLDDRARMNIPGTLGGNWQWRMTGNPSKSAAARLRRMTCLYGRNGAFGHASKERTETYG